MKASLLLLNAVILALAFSTIQGAPASPYAACKDGSSLCLGLGTVSEIKADSPSCITSEHCAFFFKSTFSASSGFHFSLTAPTLPADRFIAVALSNETGMAGLVVQCFHNSATGKNTIEDTTTRAIPDQRSVIGLASPAATYANGGLSCSWTAPANGHVSYKGHEDFNLLTTAYYLKMATGAVNSSTGAISRHATHDATGRVAASAAVNLSKAKGIILAKEVHHKAPPSSVFAPELPQDGQSGLYDQCKANTALCFGLPEGCTTTGNCKFFFKSVYASGSGFTFSLIAPSIAADQYVAVAFSPLSGMSGLVVQCFHAPSGANTIQYSFNKEYDNELITDPGKDLKGFIPPGHHLLERPAELPVDGAGRAGSFDFEHVQYFLKVATGAVKGGAISKHAHDGRLASKTAVSLKAKGTIHGGGGSGAATAIKWHDLSARRTSSSEIAGTGPATGDPKGMGG
ncbi:hypothetical protein TYRP_002726 [Tyrophagus putrescentiae]|nr:hypothetical protein TYRP_002726 [Tyrophagus putrescentiae]